MKIQFHHVQKKIYLIKKVNIQKLKLFLGSTLTSRMSQLIEKEEVMCMIVH